MKYSIKSVQILCLVVMALAFQSCKKDKDNTPISALSFVNASVGAPSLEVYLEPNKINHDQFSYGRYIDYLNVFSGQRTVSFYEGTVKKKSGNIDLKDGKFYSLFLAGTWPETELVLIKDSLTIPATGKTNIRFVNMSSDAGELDLGLTNGSTLISQKAYKASSNYTSINGNATYNFVIRKHASPLDTVSITAASLEAGRSYTIWAKGLKAEVGQNALGLTIIKNK